MTAAFDAHLREQLAQIEADGLTKHERPILSPQGAEVHVASGDVINLCANNYLGLADHPRLIDAARRGLDERGFGVASVRFICGTQDAHQELERRIAGFLGQQDSILYSSCFDANGGLFETLLTAEDAVVSDALNHASIIDGIRLSKARRFRYANNDMADLEQQLKAARDGGARFVMVATDGVFSMDGTIARLPEVLALAERYDAQVMVDDSHAVGVLGEGGRGTHEHHGLLGRIDIITGTLGKALGGASGGYVAASGPIVAMLRQRSRPYLFSNSLAPPIVAASLEVLDMLEESHELRERLTANSRYFRAALGEAGFELAGDGHPIIPVMIGDARLAAEMAGRLLAEGIYVVGFSFPVVPRGQARIRTQMSAALSRAQLDCAVDAFVRIGRELEVIR